MEKYGSRSAGLSRGCGLDVDALRAVILRRARVARLRGAQRALRVLTPGLRAVATLRPGARLFVAADTDRARTTTCFAPREFALPWPGRAVVSEFLPAMAEQVARDGWPAAVLLRASCEFRSSGSETRVSQLTL